VLIQGDSRNLAQVLGGAEGVVSSPGNLGNMKSTAAGLQAAVSSPPYADTPIVSFTDDKERTQIILAELKEKGYIEWQGKRYTEAEWRALNHGRIDGRTMRGAKKGMTGYSAAVASPPYAETGLNYGKNGLLENGEKPYKRPYMNGQNGYSAAVASPPYAGIMTGQAVGAGKDNTERRIERLREAGYSPEKILTPGRRAHGNLGEMEHYGVTPGQLGAMKADGFKAVVSSPPFKGQSADGGWQMLGKYAEEGKLTVVQVGGDSSKSYPSWNKERDTSYGHAEGQLADMAEGLFEAAVSSPPFEKSETGGALPPEKYPQIGGPIFGYRKETTGCSDGNISNDSGDNFWSAAKQIVEQVYQVLAPGGYAVWVLKAFVKNKAIVDFPGQWRQLCEAVGFETLHEHHASLVKEKGTHYLLDGGKIHKTTKNASFFRRLAESKGSPEINWETVLCMQKHVLTVEQS